MTLVLIGKGLVLRGWPSKIEAKTGSIMPFWESSHCLRPSPWILFEKRCRAINYRRGKAIGDQLGNVYRKQEIKGKVVGFVLILSRWSHRLKKHHPLLQKTQHVFFKQNTFSDMFFLQVRIPPFFLGVWSRKPGTCEASLDGLNSRTCTFQLLAFGQKLGSTVWEEVEDPNRGNLFC